MPRKPKYSDQQYGELYQELLEIEDIEDEQERREEADGVFHNYGRNRLFLGDKWQSLKNGFIAKARARSKKGDWSMLQLYADIYGDDKVDLSRAISRYPKKVILDWIFKLSDYPEDNREYIQESLAGGQNDKFYQHVLEDMITTRMDRLDEKWLQHRKNIHENWKKIDFKSNWTFWMYLVGIGGLTVSSWFSDGRLWGGLFWLLIFTIFVGYSILSKHRNNIVQGLRDEQYLIMDTENQVMNLVPKELLNYIYNKRMLNQFNEDYYNIGRDTDENWEDFQKYMNDLGKDVNFAETGLIDYCMDSNNWVLPAEYSRWYRFVLKMVQRDIDEGRYNRITEPTPPRNFVDYQTLETSEELDQKTRIDVAGYKT